MRKIKVFVVLFFALASGAPTFCAPLGQKPRIAIVIDDFGLTYPKNKPDEAWMKISWPYTAAVMPESPRTRQAAEALKKAGKEVIIHFPFDPYLKLELPGGEKAAPSDLDKARRLLDKAALEIPSAVGLNNHRSLKATKNTAFMRAFLPEVKKRGFYFLDSRVSSETVAFKEARAAGMKSAINDIFLEEGKIHTKEFCERMLRSVAGRARKRGYAVAIGHHYFQGTYDCLTELVPRLRKEGFEFVFASQVVR